MGYTEDSATDNEDTEEPQNELADYGPHTRLVYGIPVKVVDDFEATSSPRLDQNANIYVENGREIVAVGVKIQDSDAGTGQESLGGPSGIVFPMDSGSVHFSPESGAGETLTSILEDVVDKRIATKDGRPVATAHYDIKKNTLLRIEVDAKAVTPNIRNGIKENNESALKTEGRAEEGANTYPSPSFNWKAAANDDNRSIADYVKQNYPDKVDDWTFQHQNGEYQLFVVYERGDKDADGNPVKELYISGEKGREDTYAVQYWEREWGTAATARYLGRYKRESSAWARAVEMMRKPNF